MSDSTQFRFEFLLNYIPALRPYMVNPAITEIMVNPVEGGTYRVFVEEDAEMREVQGLLLDEQSLCALATDIARNQLNREINEKEPALSASFPDGSRVAILVPPNASGGIAMTIRKFRPQRFTLPELIAGGAITEDLAALLQREIIARKNVLLSGANGSGKTTMLNALASACIPINRRVVVIEDDMREIHLDQHANKLHLQASKQHSVAKLVKNALRYRIQNIIVGEVIGEEGMALLNALSTGHSGSFATIHAEDEATALDRLTACAMEAGNGLTYQAVRLRIVQAIHYVLQMVDRKVVSVSRVAGYNFGADRFNLDPVEFEGECQMGASA